MPHKHMAESEILRLQQQRIAAMKACRQPYEVEVLGKNILVYPRVFCPATDTKLLIKAMTINADDKVLEVCTGTGVIAVFAAERARDVTATDINSQAVVNAKANSKQHSVSHKMKCVQTDLFPAGDEQFNVILINPPYTDHTASDVVEKSCWDYSHTMLKRFLTDAPAHLARDGCIYIRGQILLIFRCLRHLQKGNMPAR